MAATLGRPARAFTRISCIVTHLVVEPEMSQETLINQARIALGTNGELALTIPHDTQASLDHTIQLPCDENGLRLIRRILAARDAGQVKLGQNGKPTQSTVDAWLKNKNEVDLITKREEAAKLEAAKREAEKLSEAEAAKRDAEALACF